MPTVNSILWEGCSEVFRASRNCNPKIPIYTLQYRNLLTQIQPYVTVSMKRRVLKIQWASTGKDREMTGAMTDKQMEVILNLVADKFAGCQSMEDVKQAIKEVREMARTDKTHSSEN